MILFPFGHFGRGSTVRAGRFCRKGRLLALSMTKAPFIIHMTSSQRWFLALAIFALTGLLIWVAQAQDVLEPFLNAKTWQAWREWLRHFGILAPLVSILLSAIQIVPLPIPAPTIPLANGWLFGLWGGTLVTWSGVMLNGIIGYWVAWRAGRHVLRRFLPTKQLARAEQLLEQHGVLAVMLARLIPILPFGVINIAAGLLHMRWRDYLLATALGITPSAFALALIGDQLSRGAVDWQQVAIAVVILGGMALAGLSVRIADKQ